MFAAPAPPPQLCWISSKAPTKPAQIPANGIARPWSARPSPRSAHAKNQFITLLQALNRQRQPAKLVFAIRVGAGDVAQQVCLKLAESRAEGVIQPAEIIGVADAIRQIHING